MKMNIGLIAAVGALGALLATPVDAAPTIGAPAPAFIASDSNGKPIALGDFAGKTVVLEWTNDGCPYVQKHYSSGNMQALQAEAAKEGVVWLSVISSAPGTQGYVDGVKANALTASRNAKPARVILDPDGKVGRAYQAKTTPHMYVIDPKGKLAYMGGIDDKRSTDVKDIPASKNYVRAALADLKAGRAVAVAEATPYGCSVKYKN